MQELNGSRWKRSWNPTRKNYGRFQKWSGQKGSLMSSGKRMGNSSSSTARKKVQQGGRAYGTTVQHGGRVRNISLKRARWNLQRKWASLCLMKASTASCRNSVTLTTRHHPGSVRRMGSESAAEPYSVISATIRYSST